MRVLLVPALLAMHEGEAFLFWPVPSSSRIAGSTRQTEPAVSARRPRTTAAAVTRFGSRGDGDADADMDVEGFMSSLKSSGLFGENDSAGAAGSGDGLAATASDAAADLEEPGKLVREAAKPFREKMDRIEADFQRSMAEKEEEMERKLEELLKKVDENK